MKKIILLLSVATLIVCCAPKTNNIEADRNALVEAIEALDSDTTMTYDQLMAQYNGLILDTYNKHKSDSLGLEMFMEIIVSDMDSQEILKLYNESSELVKGDLKVTTKIAAIENLASTGPGADYIDVTGVDALTGEPLSLSQFVGGPKQVLIDFWASWCSPCRNAIKNHLLDIAAKGEIQIVGIAVWEDSVEDTKKAMSELGITWPVIYTGGREDSPSVSYGVLGIPTMILLTTDGKIVSRGHQITDVFAE